MWSFKVLADITSMFSLYCNSTKNRNNNITMILTLDDIGINVKILISSFSSEALMVVSLRKPNILAISPRNFTTTRLPHFTVTLLEASSYDKTTSVRGGQVHVKTVSHVCHRLEIPKPIQSLKKAGNL